MKAEDVVIGGYYVMGRSGVIRHLYGLGQTGKARYHTYDPTSGEHMMTSSCALEDFIYRAERKATPDEISRLNEWHIETEYQRSSLGKVLRNT